MVRPPLFPPSGWRAVAETDRLAQVFAGKDASRALGKTSTNLQDFRTDWHDLSDKEKSTLADWVTFSKRYNVVGVVEGANMEE